MDINQVAQLLNDTLSLDVNAVRTATDALDRLSLLPHFPFCLLYIASGNFSPVPLISTLRFILFA